MSRFDRGNTSSGCAVCKRCPFTAEIALTCYRQDRRIANCCLDRDDNTGRMAKNIFSCGTQRLAGCWALLLAASSATAAVVTGGATEVASNVRHPNGNIYDQVLLTGAAATVQNDPGQITRVSFIDLNDDIVQVEFSGAGSLTFALDGASGPAPARKYNQPGVSYMKGHAALTIVNCDASTNVGIFSVGTTNAQDKSLFRTGEMYDGIADLRVLTIIASAVNPNGSTFGGIRAGNAQFWGTSGVVGIAAANVQVQDVVVIGDLWAIDAAIPVLSVGQNSQFGAVTVAGGVLSQPNGKTILATGYRYSVSAVDGRTSNNFVLPWRLPRAQLMRDNGLVETLSPDPNGGPIFVVVPL